MPEDDDMVYFKNYHKGLEASFDSLFMLILRLSIKRYTDVSQIIKSYTESYQKDKDCGYEYKVVCCYDNKYSKPIQIYRR